MKRAALLLAPAALVGVMWSVHVPNATQADEEWETNTIYYEDDAWYDVSEWLDGNDYNPTDEVFGRWDNESYNAVINDDQDNDWNSSYGFSGDSRRSDWFYDYYDDGYADYGSDDQTTEVYGRVHRYYDFDDDGMYDAYAWFHDMDGDGKYENYNYYSLSSSSNASSSQQANKKAEQQAQQDAEESSKRFQISGEIDETKEVEVRGEKHLVAHVKLDQGTFVLDLGPAKQAQEWHLSKGDKLSAQGPIARIGEKRLMIAKSIQTDGGNQQTIDRSRNEITGKIKSLKTASLRDAEHQLALISSKDRENQLLVDLGRKDKLSGEFAEGDELTVHGVPVRIKDKPAMLAQKVTHDGETMKIDRQSESGNDQASNAKDQSQQTAQR